MISSIRSALILISLLALTAAGATGPTATISDLPLAFTENAGQWPDSILFQADAGAAAMWFTAGGAYYQFTRRSKDGERILETDMIRAVFEGAQTSPSVTGEGRLPGHYNYFLGDEPAGWRTDVPAYGAVVYEDLYPGIDLRYYGQGGMMEYDFAVKPGADLAQVSIRYEGAQSLAVNAAGELVVQTAWATVTERTPFAYQVDGDRIVPVTVVYELVDELTFGFAIVDPIRPELALVVDPILTCSSYLGGSGSDLAHAVAVDEFGHAYVAGITASTNFPTQGPYQGDQGGNDVFVIKLSADGQTLVYGSYIGGGASDEGWSLAVDDKGDAYVAGVTESTDFPTVNAFQTDQSFPDGFVAKLNGLGNDLVYSTYIGGGSFDEVRAIAVDDLGHAYVTGVTSSSNFPTKNPYLTDMAGDDAFILKLAPTGDSLIYGTYLGGDLLDLGLALALDVAGNVYTTGQTRSSDIPAVNAFQDTYHPGDWDAYVIKLNAAGNAAIYSTYLGGADLDVGQGIAVDATGHAYVTGVTSSTDFPTDSSFQADQPSDDAFLVKFNPAGNALMYGTYLGGSAQDYGRDVAVDADGNAYVVGWTLSSDFPTVDPIQTANDTVDAFAVIFNTDGSALDYGTYLSGSGVDDARGVAVTPGGDAYIAGRTDSPNFLTLNPYQTDQIGRDAFVLMLEMLAVAVSDDDAGRPEDFELLGNYPNPFNLGTVVRFTLARPEKVELTIYNVLGENIATVCDRVLPAGTQEVRWNGRDASGTEMPSGVYLYRLKTGERVQESRMTLVK